MKPKLLKDGFELVKRLALVLSSEQMKFMILLYCSVL
jgi:hypothetical protein